MWRVGDLVMRHSHDRDLCFVIVRLDFDRRLAILKGLDVRLLADSPLDDLARVTELDWRNYQVGQAKLQQETLRLVQMRRQVDRDKEDYRSEKERYPHDFFERPGRVLHLDGDGSYLERCLSIYQRLGVHATGKNLPEQEMAGRIEELLAQFAPDILIITGHDGVLRKGAPAEVLQIDNYRNSDSFVKAVRAARRYERSLDELVIFAGACQSHYEALLEAGANFASSPDRILIHALDPVLVAEKIAFTPIGETIDIYHIVRSTITGTEGLGGVQSRGKYRIGLPRSRY